MMPTRLTAWELLALAASIASPVATIRRFILLYPPRSLNPLTHCWYEVYAGDKIIPKPLSSITLRRYARTHDNRYRSSTCPGAIHLHERVFSPPAKRG